MAALFNKIVSNYFVWLGPHDYVTSTELDPLNFRKAIQVFDKSGCMDFYHENLKTQSTKPNSNM